ncbi:MAG: HNH endonuclease signature motif containing protein, partial [Acidobacteriota bacterium]
LWLECREEALRRFAPRRPAAWTEAGPAEAYPLERSLLEADALAQSLRGALERIDVPLARAAAGFARQQGWVTFGFACLDDHARERFGRSGRWLRDLAALGRALDSLPGLVAALTGEDGGRPPGRVAALLIGRVASAATLDRWITLARGVTVRELREAVRAARAAGSDSPAGAQAARVGAQAEPVGRAPGDPAADDEDDGLALRSLVRFPVPAPVLAAFDEAVDLHRAVSGCEATVTSFVEALVAEAASAGWPDDDRPRGEAWVHDADRAALKSGPERAVIESALARSTDRWSNLRSSAGPSWALALAGDSLSRLEGLSRRAGGGGPAEIDAQIRELISLEDEMERRLGHLLAGMTERGAWPRLRFAGTGHYAEERLGMSRTSAEDRARLARSLRRFPLLREAYEGGRVGLEVASLIVRILGAGSVPPDDEALWVARGEEATVKRMRDEARALGRWRFLDERPPARHVLRPRPDPLDDGEWHASLRREPGTARGRVIRLGMSAVLTAEVSAAAAGPDVFLRLRLPDGLAVDFLAAVEVARRSLADRVDEVPWHEPWPDPGAPPSVLAARMFSTRSRRVPAWVGLLALIEDFVVTWDRDQRQDARGRVPKQHGEAVYVRDGWRCTAPGCTSRRGLEDHHLVYRSRQGIDDLSNRTCLCWFHHRTGEHGALASCRGSAPLGITWRLGRSDVGRRYRNERRLERSS